MKRLAFLLGTLSLLSFHSCDRNRTNPIDPQSNLLQVRPLTPAGLTAVAGPGIVALAWLPVIDPDLVGYGVFRATESNGEYGFVQGEGDVGLQITTGKNSFVDSVDAAGQTFFYRVSAVDVDSVHSFRSTFVGATVLADLVAPAPPQILSALIDEVEIGRVVVRWSAPSRDEDGGPLTGLESYVLLRSKGNTGSFVVVDTLAAGVLEFVDEDLEPLTEYAYAMIGLDAAGNESRRSTQVEITVGGLAVPAGLSAEGEVGRIALSWNTIEDKEVIGYDVFRSDRSDGDYERLVGFEGGSFTTGQTAYVDSNLTSGRLFFYKVQSVAEGSLRSEQSGLVSATVLADLVSPGTPENVSVIADEVDVRRLNLRWTAPTRDADGANLTGLSSYVVLRAEGTVGSFVAIDTLGADQLTYVDEGLSSLTTYSYAVIALDELGNASPRSDPVQAQTGGVPTPTGLQASGEIERVVLTWNGSLEDDLIGYDVLRADASDGTYILLDGEGSTFTTGQTTFVDSVDLEADQQYFYKIRAVTSSRASERSVFVGVRVLADDVPPAPPENLSVTTVADSADELVLRWSEPAVDEDGGELTGLTQYVILRSEDGSGSFVPIDTVAAGVDRYRDTGLAFLTLYGYVLVARDHLENESRRSEIVEAQTAGLSPPDGLVATSEIGRIVLTWFESDIEDLHGYDVLRASASDGVYVELRQAEGDAFTTGQTTYIDSSLTPGETAFYRVRAVAETAVGPSSAFVGGEVLADDSAPGSPLNLIVVRNEDLIESLVVRWSPPGTDDDGTRLTGLDVYVILRSEGGLNQFVVVDTVAASVQVFADQGLKPLTSYVYAVVALDSLGNESPRAQAPAALTGGVAIPPGLQASGEIDRVVITWFDSEEADLLGYNVWRSSRADTGYVRLDGDGGEAFTTGKTTYLDSSVTPEAEVFYKISAVTFAGESERSVFVGTASRTDDVGPGVPPNVVAVLGDPTNQAIVRWGAPLADADGGPLSGLESYLVMRSDGGNSSFVVLDTVAAALLEYVDAGLEPLTLYVYAIIAQDVAGNKSGQAISREVSTPGFAAPDGLLAVPEPDRVVLTWFESEEPGLEGYIVYRSLVSDADYAAVTADDFTTGQSTYIDSTVEEGREYFYRITALLEGGQESENSPFVGVLIPAVEEDATPPAQPENLLVLLNAGDNGSLTFTWTPPPLDSDGEELKDLARYVIYRSEGGNTSFVVLDTVTADSARYVDVGLAPLSLYVYAITALDTIGNESERAIATEARTGGVQVPTGLTATGEIGRIRLLWSDSGEQGLRGYNVYRSEQSQTGYVLLPGPGNGFSTGQTSFVDSTVSDGDEYFYKVSALAVQGESELSTFVGSSSLPDDVPPGSPLNVLVVTIPDSVNRLTVRWSPPTLDEGGGTLSGLDRFLILRSIGGNTSFVVLDTVARDTREYHDSGLAPLTLYVYAIVAVDAAGNESSQAVGPEAITGGIESPSGLVAVADSARVSLIWSASEDDQLRGYNVYRSEDSEGGYTLLTGAESGEFTTGQTAYVDSNLAEGVIFFYRISAVTPLMESELSAFVGAQVPEVEVDETGPGAPQNLLVLTSEGVFDQLTFTWTAPAEDADGSQLSGVASYTILRSKGGNTVYVEVGSVDAGTFEFVDNGLDQLTVYVYAVVAVDEVGNEGVRAVALQATTGGVTVPEGLVATAGPGEITLTWFSSQVQGLRGYNVYRATSSDGDYVIQSGSGDLTTGQNSFVDSSLTAGEEFFYKITAVTDQGESPRSLFVGAEVEADQIGPDAPQNLLVVLDSDRNDRLTFSWTPPIQDADGSALSGLDRYVIYRSIGGSTSFVVVDTVAASVLVHVDAGLETGTLYVYAVRGLDESGNEGLQNTVGASTRALDETGPGAPRSLVVVQDADRIDQLTFSWAPPTLDADGSALSGLDRYVIYRSFDGSTSFVVVDTVDASVREYVDTGLETGTLYVYAVSGLDESGNEGLQNTVGASTRALDETGPGPPGSLVVVQDADRIDQLTFSWAPPTLDADGSALSGLDQYVIYRSIDGSTAFVVVDTVDASVLVHVDTGLEPGTLYVYAVSGLDESGNEGLQNTVGASTRALDETGPGAPRSLLVVLDDAQIDQLTFSWSAPTLDADGSALSGLDRYVIYRSIGGSTSLVVVDTVAASVTERVDTGLEQRTVYVYAVTGLDELGNEGTRAIAQEAVTGGVVVPENLVAAGGIGRIDLTWTESDAEGLLGYNVYRSDTAEGTYSAVTGDAGDSFTTAQTAFVDSGLAGGDRFYYRLTAVTEDGESERSIFVTAAARVDDVGPAAPDALSATADETNIGQVVLTWKAPKTDADGGELTGLENYVVLRRREGEGALSSIATLNADSLDAASGNLGSGVVQHADTGLDTLTTYTYTVVATDSTGNESDQATSVEVQTSGVAIPTGVTAVGGFRQITIGWDASSESDLIGYNVYRSSSSNGNYSRQNGDGNGFTTGRTTFANTSLSAGAVFFYRVTAVTSSTESQRSGFVSAEAE